MEPKVWHNDEAGALANRVRAVVRAWDKGCICPNEFLLQLEDLVRGAREERNRSIREADPADIVRPNERTP